MKICSKCKREKELNKFYFKNKALGIHRSQCIDCLFLIRKDKKDVKAIYDKENYILNKPDKLAKSILYSQTHKEQKRKYDQKHLKQVLQQRRKRYSIDLSYKIICNLRSRLHVALKRNKKGFKTLELLGCTIEEFKSYIEKLFTQDMSWNKVMSGDIHIDHIKPCCAFDFSDIDQQKICFHYTNLQPLWAKDNRQKYNKII